MAQGMQAPKPDLRAPGECAGEAMTPTVFVVIPVHNRKHLTQKCLQCLANQEYQRHQTILVDDGSTDGTSEMVREEFPKVLIERGDGNLWWTGAVNRGIRAALARAAQTDFVLLLNDDLEFDPDYLATIVKAGLAHPRTLVGSVEVDINAPDTIVNGGIRINWFTAGHTSFNRHKHLSTFPRDYQQTDVSYLTGRGTLIPISAFREIGLYDELHFAQCGDPEFPARAKKNGYALMINYATAVRSHTSAGAGINIQQRYRIGDLRRCFFDVKSNMRLKYRFWFAYNSRKNLCQFASFLACDFARITWHFVSRLRISG
jgi:GT2 family glycosyltransferase